MNDEQTFTRPKPLPDPIHHPARAGAVVLGIAVCVGAALIGLPRAGPLPQIARESLLVALPKWHTTEPVNEIVYGTRGFDTFGETFILLGAVVSVMMLARSKERRRGFFGEEVAGEREREEIGPDTSVEASERASRAAELLEVPEAAESRGPSTPDEMPLGAPAPDVSESMTVVIRTSARIVVPILAVAGLYLVAWGYSPGGGFPGGAVILGVVLLLYVSFGYRRIRGVVRKEPTEAIELAGAIAIVALGLIGWISKGSFMTNFLPLGRPETITSGGLLQAFSGCELVEVGSGLTLAMFSLLGMAHDWAEEDGSDDSLSSERHSR